MVAYTLLEGIGAAYRYVLKHTSLTESEDLYQDVACEYIRIRNSGAPHRQACGNLLYKFTRAVNNNKVINISFSINDIAESVYIVDVEDRILDKVIVDYIKSSVIRNALTEREEHVITEWLFEGRPFTSIAIDLGVSFSRVSQIAHESLRKIKYRAWKELGCKRGKLYDN